MTIYLEASEQSSWRNRYYQIRQQCFQQELGIDAFDGSEDALDRHGKIFILRDDDRCVGGIRLSGRVQGRPGMLPLEQNGLDLTDSFPHLLRDARGYCQWTRLAVLPDYRNRIDLFNLCQMLIQSAAALGYDYAFFVSGRTRARLYRKLHRRLGYAYEIVEGWELEPEPGFAGLPHELSISSLLPGCTLDIDPYSVVAAGVA